MVRNKDGIESLKNFFLKKDIEHIRLHKKGYHYTKNGVFAPTDILLAKAVFDKIGLDRFETFIDLGSGDGRLVFLASYYTQSTGIELDSELLNDSIESKRLLNIDCDLICEDYNSVDLSKFDIIFIAPDTHFHHGLEKKLKSEMNGILVVNSPLYLPRFLKRIDSFTIDGMPISLFRNI